MKSATHCRERALWLPCEGDHLFAVLSEPEGSASSDLGVVVVVGGPQYRAGSHRSFVQLARTLAGAGFPTLRFDVRGMGDSTGVLRTFEQISPDIGSAIDTLMAEQPQLRCVVLWGLCDAASATLLYLHDRPDPRVVGLCLLNPWVRSQASLARTHVKHYYRQRLLQPDFWSKLFSGQIARGAMKDLLQALRQVRSNDGSSIGAAIPLSFQANMAAAWKSFSGKIVLMLSGQDFTAKEFLELTSRSQDWAAAFLANAPEKIEIANADHTFSQPKAWDAAANATLSMAALTQRGVPRCCAGPGAVCR